MSVCDYFKKEDLEDMNNINDNSMFSVFDIRDALNQTDNPPLKYEQIESIFYILNEFKENEDEINCEVCKKNFDWNDELAGCLDIEEILDCSDTQINKWQEQNKNIDLQSYFCSECANKTIQAIEENEDA